MMTRIHFAPASNRQREHRRRVTEVAIRNDWHLVEGGNLVDERGQVLKGHAATTAKAPQDKRPNRRKLRLKR